MKKTFVILFLCCAIMSCKGLLKKPVFYIATPADWVRKDTVENSDSLIKLKSTADLPGKNIKETISLLVEGSFNRNDPEHNALRRELKSDADFYEETGRGHRVIDGIESYWFEVAVKFKTNNFPCTQRYYFTTGQRFRYMFICTCPERGYEHLRPVADSVLNSFKILD